MEYWGRGRQRMVGEIKARVKMEKERKERVGVYQG